MSVGNWQQAIPAESYYKKKDNEEQNNVSTDNESMTESHVHGEDQSYNLFHNELTGNKKFVQNGEKIYKSEFFKT